MRFSSPPTPKAARHSSLPLPASQYDTFQPSPLFLINTEPDSLNNTLSQPSSIRLTFSDAITALLTHSNCQTAPITFRDRPSNSTLTIIPQTQTSSHLVASTPLHQAGSLLLGYCLHHVLRQSTTSPPASPSCLTSASLRPVKTSGPCVGFTLAAQQQQQPTQAAVEGSTPSEGSRGVSHGEGLPP